MQHTVFFQPSKQGLRVNMEVPLTREKLLSADVYRKPWTTQSIIPSAMQVLSHWHTSGATEWETEQGGSLWVLGHPVSNKQMTTKIKAPGVIRDAKWTQETMGTRLQRMKIFWSLYTEFTSCCKKRGLRIRDRDLRKKDQYWGGWSNILQSANDWHMKWARLYVESSGEE